MIAPTMEWVVDTGQPLIVASNSQTPAASKAESMPKTSRSGVMYCGATMPLLIVSVTSPPAK